MGEKSPVTPPPENLSPRSKSGSPHLRDITEIKQEPIEIEEEDEEEAERQTLLQVSHWWRWLGIDWKLSYVGTLPCLVLIVLKWVVICNFAVGTVNLSKTWREKEK